MLISARRLLLALLCVIAASGIVIWIHPIGKQLAWLVVVGAVVGIVILIIFSVPHRDTTPREPESDDIGQATEERLKELVRGTSLHLRDMNYRYSVRIDTSQAGDRHCFSADINTIKLGFVPIFLMDRGDDRQGMGYLAFVHDGKRWRGPGLPCPADQADAVRHAAQCVSPLTTDDEKS